MHKTVLADIPNAKTVADSDDLIGIGKRLVSRSIAIDSCAAEEIVM
jgi:hypothetical protein